MARARKNIRLPAAVGAYANLFKPRPPMDGKGEPKYELTLLYPKADAAKVLAPLIATVKAVAKEAFGDKGEDIVRKMKYPIIKDGDDKDQPEFKGKVFVRTSGERKPGVVGVVDGQKQLVFDEDEAYSGCTFIAAVSVYSYDNEFGKGVSIGLDNVYVVKKGPRMDGRKSAEDEFKDVEPEEGSDDSTDVNSLL